MSSESFNGIASLGKFLSERIQLAAARTRAAREEKQAKQNSDCSGGCCSVTWKPMQAVTNLSESST